MRISNVRSCLGSVVLTWLGLIVGGPDAHVEFVVTSGGAVPQANARVTFDTATPTTAGAVIAITGVVWRTRRRSA